MMRLLGWKAKIVCADSAKNCQAVTNCKVDDLRLL